MNISHFPTTLEASDKNQWFQVLGDFHRKLIRVRYWQFPYAHSLKVKVEKVTWAQRFAINSVSSDPQMALSVSMVYKNSSPSKADVCWSMKLLALLWVLNLHRTLPGDDSPSVFLSPCLLWTSSKEESWYNYGQFWLAQTCTWIINDGFLCIAMVLKTQEVWNGKLNVLLTVQFTIMSIDHMPILQA